jgi:hypothetical protein
MTNESASVWKIILVPSLVTLAVTVIRLIGELGRWNEAFFGRKPGGGGAVVGIVWLAFIFAIYFAVKVQNNGDSPASPGKAIGIALIALVVFIGGEFLVFKGMQSTSSAIMLGGIVAVIASVFIMRIGWPGYWNVLVTYALAARIPVVVIMYLAISGSWGTHYDAVGPEFQNAAFSTKIFQLAIVPQLTFWVAFTTILCGIFGLITAAVRKGRLAHTPA